MSSSSTIREVAKKAITERAVGIHSHISGLGLDEKWKPLPVGDGLVGQLEAREAAGLIVRLVREGKRPGHGLLLVGPPGTGKTAIAIGMARELGKDVPFVSISGSEIYGSYTKKTELLKQAMRRAIGLRITEEREVYEGEVTSIEIEKAEHPFNPYTQVAYGALLTLKTGKEEKTIEVGDRIAAQLMRMGVRVGDVIEIDAETGHVVKLGRSSEAPSKWKGEFKVAKIIPRPDGPVKKTKKTSHVVTLHDIDMANLRIGRSLLFREEEISDEVRQKVDEEVQKAVGRGEAKLIPGVLFIDEAHMLDVEAFSFLNRALEQEFAPVLVLATNRAMARVKGTDVIAPHGIPIDMLDRLLIAKTSYPTRDEIRRIVEIRASTEGVELSPEALNLLADIGEKLSLRHAVRLIAPAKAVADIENSSVVKPEHIERAKSVFIDVRESVQYMQEVLKKDPLFLEFLK